VQQLPAVYWTGVIQAVCAGQLVPRRRVSDVLL